MPLSITLSQASGVPFYRQIETQITESIRAGGLAPGERLPSVRELAGELLVSTITVRKAFEDLERAGLIELRQGQGTFVAAHLAPALGTQSREEARELLDAAIARARRLGLSDLEIRTLVDTALGGNHD